MQPRRTLITGANGFVGRHLIHDLVQTYGPAAAVFAGVRPCDIGTLGTVPAAAGWSGSQAPNVEIMPFELLDRVQVSAAVLRSSPDWIFHLAARSSGGDQDRDTIRAVNVEGTRNLLDAAAELDPFPRVLIVSTGYVYGNTDPLRPAREEDPVGPLWRYGPYTDSKIEMESVARNYRGFATVVRPFSHTGPGQGAGFVVPAFARQLALIERAGSPAVMRVGELNAARDILDVRDVVRAYRHLLDVGLAGEVYNVATSSPTTIRELLDGLRAQVGMDIEIEIDPQLLRPSDILRSSGDPLKLWTATNWRPRIPLESTLRDTLDYWRGLTTQ